MHHTIKREYQFLRYERSVPSISGPIYGMSGAIPLLPLHGADRQLYLYFYTFNTYKPAAVG